VDSAGHHFARALHEDAALVECIGLHRESSAALRAPIVVRESYAPARKASAYARFAASQTRRSESVTVSGLGHSVEGGNRADAGQFFAQLRASAGLGENRRCSQFVALRDIAIVHRAGDHKQRDTRAYFTCADGPEHLEATVVRKP